MLAQPLGCGLAARKPWPTVVREARGQAMAMGWLRRAPLWHIGPGRVLEFFGNSLKLLIRISTDADQLNQHKNRLPQFLLAKNAAVSHHAGVVQALKRGARFGQALAAWFGRLFSSASAPEVGASCVRVTTDRCSTRRDSYMLRKILYAGLLLLGCALFGCSAVPVFAVPGIQAGATCMNCGVSSYRVQALTQAPTCNGMCAICSR